MDTVNFPGNLRVTGNLQVDGSILPGVPRASLIQDNFAAFDIPFDSLRLHDAFQTPISTASGTALGLSTGGTYGTNAPYISAGDVKASTTTRRARCLFVLPPSYVAGQSVRLSASAGMVTTASDTSCTLACEAYKLAGNATVSGSQLVSTAALSINSTTFSAKNFDLNTSTLAPGDVLDLRFTIATVDSATATAVIPAIASLLAQLDIQG